MNYSLTWDLNTIFPGGSHSKELQQRMATLDEQITELHQAVQSFEAEKRITTNLLTILNWNAKVSNGFEECGSFIEALLSADVSDTKAKLLSGELSKKIPKYQLAMTIFSKKLAAIETNDWKQWLTDSKLKSIAFRLEEIRRDGNKLLSDTQENIFHTLSLDGLKAWSQHYDTIVASITIPFTEKDGSKVELSAGQAFNKMNSHPDADVRAEIFEKWEQAWSQKADLFSDTLNHLDGFRLSTQKLHGIENYLQEPLENNRLKQETLDTMWSTIQKNKQPFVDYLTRKAQLLGNDKMKWQDQEAPVLLGNMHEETYTFDEAAAFIIKNFREFSPKMATFAQSAFENSWIEAEDRPGKRPGGYCTSFPESQESRIFMTYSHSMNEVATIAHELGHAFHSSVMWDLPVLNQEYAMNVAETASTFAELIVADATLKKAQTKEEKINLLDVKLQNAIAMFMNIHTRYIFENHFYQARQKGLVSTEQISEMMVNAQKESYLDSLANYHPHFWAAKLHFFIDDVPFYNFPYTFGYLFSTGIYAFANEQKTNFEEDYIALLRDTAAMTTEELAKKHLGVDLTQPDFWQAGINKVLEDVNEFMSLTKDYV